MAETLRLSKTDTFSARVDTADREAIRVGGHLVPRGTPIINALSVALDDEKYFPDPER